VPHLPSVTEEEAKARGNNATAEGSGTDVKETFVNVVSKSHKEQTGSDVNRHRKNPSDGGSSASAPEFDQQFVDISCQCKVEAQELLLGSIFPLLFVPFAVLVVPL